MVSTGYSGQFGGAAGGNINYITKSGSNEFHGNAQYYWNGTAFNADDWFLKAIGKPRFSESANQWAGSVGGPIKEGQRSFIKPELRLPTPYRCVVRPTSLQAPTENRTPLCVQQISAAVMSVTPHHAKSGQGSGDGVPGGGEAAVVSSLDPIQTNRNKQLGRGKHCGRFTVRGRSPRILPKLASTGSIASPGIAPIALPDERSALSTPFARRLKLCNCVDSSP